MVRWDRGEATQGVRGGSRDSTRRRRAATGSAAWRNIGRDLVRTMYCTARSAVVGPNPKSAHTSSIHSMRVARYFMCRAVAGSRVQEVLVSSRSRSVASTSAHTDGGVDAAAARAPYESHSSRSVDPRKGPGTARSAAAAAVRCCSLISR